MASSGVAQVSGAHALSRLRCGHSNEVGVPNLSNGIGSTTANYVSSTQDRYRIEIRQDGLKTSQYILVRSISKQDIPTGNQAFGNRRLTVIRSPLMQRRGETRRLSSGPWLCHKIAAEASSGGLRVYAWRRWLPLGTRLATSRSS